MAEVGGVLGVEEPELLEEVAPTTRLEGGLDRLASQEATHYVSTTPPKATQGSGTRTVSATILRSHFLACGVAAA